MSGAFSTLHPEKAGSAENSARRWKCLKLSRPQMRGLPQKYLISIARDLL
jgi:hypothetical protein